MNRANKTCTKMPPAIRGHLLFAIKANLLAVSAVLFRIAINVLLICRDLDAALKKQGIT